MHTISGCRKNKPQIRRLYDNLICESAANQFIVKQKMSRNCRTFKKNQLTKYLFSFRYYFFYFGYHPFHHTLNARFQRDH